MAAGDPPVIPPDQVDKSNESLKGYKDTIGSIEGAFTSLTEKAQAAYEKLLDFGSAIKSAGAENANTTTLSKEQANAFALMTTQIIGASDAYRELKMLNTASLEGQMTALWDSVNHGAKSVESLASLASGLGLPIDKIQKALAASGGSVVVFKTAISEQISTFAKSADNVNKLRDTYFQLMGASGGLAAAQERSGANFENVNLLVQEQQDKINGATAATGLAKEQIVGYYTMLGKIPGALNEQIKTTSVMGGTLDGLTAKTRLAATTGRSFADIQQDATTALRTYNIAGSDALIFVSRMTELSGKFGVELEDTKKYMTDTAETFKFIGNEADGSAKMFNKLMTAFKETGLSAKASTELISGITKQIGNLSIAQKSFLSSQTGGPGGLVGGFQIEKMLRDGKVDEVFDKMQSQMKRQFGKIVSIDEAAKSPQAAAQLTRQREMLKQGPLGKFADTDDKAQRILDAFKKGEKVDVKELSKGDALLEKNLTTGKAWQDKTHTLFAHMNVNLERIRDQGALAASKISERTVGINASGKQGAAIRRGQADGTQRAVMAIDREKYSPQDVGVANVSSAIKQGAGAAKALPDVARAGAKAIQETVSSTAARERRTGVPAASDTKKHSDDYMDLFNKSKQGNQNIAKWTAAQKRSEATGESMDVARGVGAVRKKLPDDARSPYTPETQARMRQQQMGSIKVEPITIKVIVDATGKATADYNQNVNAGINLPDGGKSA